MIRPRRRDLPDRALSWVVVAAAATIFVVLPVSGFIMAIISSGVCP